MFEKINFRYSDAKEESIYSPELIEKAFVDIDNILECIMQPGKFIVIGSKGSGKSALSAKLHQLSKWDFFVSEENLETFDYKNLSRSISNSISTTGYVDVWQMLILIRFLTLFLLDDELDNCDLSSLDSSLKKVGLSDSSSLVRIVEYTSSRGVFSALKSALVGYSVELSLSSSEMSKSNIKTPGAIVAAIRDVFGRIPTNTEKKYYLVIDGLDYPLSYGRENTVYIKDLIVASKQINEFFAALGLNAKAIILIRDEILAGIPDANLTKRINDNGISLNWFENAREPLQTSLMKIIEKRSNLAGYDKPIDSLWGLWFPVSIRGRSSIRFILDNTRFIPRDLISFFRELQKLAKQPPFSEEVVLAALANYSDWFIGELRDSLVGLVDDSIRTNLSRVLAMLDREFSYEEFSRAFYEFNGDRVKANDILNCMFETSWIGNIWKTEQGTDRFAWKHRKKNASLMVNKKMIIHCGLWKTLNLV